MQKQTAVLVINPIMSTARSYYYFTQAGIALIAYIKDKNGLAEYFKKDLQSTPFAAIIYGTLDFEENIKHIKKQQEKFDIIYGYIGCENSVAEGEKLLHAIFPTLSNDPHTSVWRYNKYDMNERLKDKNISAISQFKLSAQHLSGLNSYLAHITYPIVMKPNFNSAGSEGVSFCYNENEMYEYIDHLNTHGLLGDVSEILVQEKIEGPEYFIDTFSWKGKHSVSGIFHCQKTIVDNHPVYQTISMLNHNDPVYQKIVDYAMHALTALDIDFGFAHTEVMLNKKTQHINLIEVNLRPSGMSGYINDVAYTHQKVNQFTLAIDCLRGTTTERELDNKNHCIFILKNLGFTYDKINIELAEKLASYVSYKPIVPTCQQKPDRLLLLNSVAFIHLAHESTEQLHKDIAALEKHERDGSIFL